MPRSAVLALALVFAGCAPASPTAPPTTAASLAAGPCEGEGFTIDDADTAVYAAPTSAHVMHTGGSHGDHGEPAEAPALAGDTRCVPLQALDAPLTVSSLSGRYQFRLESLRGALTADAADNEAFVVHVLDAAGAPVANASVTLEVRMPHHNRTQPRGHGPANDPEANGFPAAARPEGGYAVDPVDFSMAGAWLVTARARIAGEAEKAYWAVKVQ